MCDRPRRFLVDHGASDDADMTDTSSPALTDAYSQPQADAYGQPQVDTYGQPRADSQRVLECDNKPGLYVAWWKPWKYNHIDGLFEVSTHGCALEKADSLSDSTRAVDTPDLSDSTRAVGTPAASKHLAASRTLPLSTRSSRNGAC